MKLNYECLRKTLIVLEEQLELKDLDYKPLSVGTVSNFPVLLNEFKEEDIAYSIYMLADAGFIKMTSGYENIIHPQIQTITYKGHEFIQKIKNDTVWNKTVSSLKPIGVFTLELISQVATNVIMKSLNLN